LNEKVATAKKLNRLSDDPSALRDAMQVKTAMAQMDQYGRNLEVADSWFNLSESALSQVLDLVARAREITVQMSSATQTAATRDSAAVEVGQLLDQAVSLGNTQLSGRYIFAGFETDTTPFTRVTAGGIDTAQYNGDTNTFRVQIGKGENLDVGKSGQSVLMGSALFNTLGTLKKALEDNDEATIAAQLNSLTTAEDHLNTQIADIGARQNRAQVKKSAFSQINNALQEQLSGAQDADLAEVIIQLNSKQATYQAALAAAARINQMSLLNYLN
jgi:flagellar hook-associated protein 3 FlgL